MHTWIPISEPNDFRQLEQSLPDVYRPDIVATILVKEMSPSIKGLLVELPYIDRDYRSTYYGYYAKKGRAYSPFCVRLHFFGDKVSLVDKTDLRIDTDQISENYYGYMVIRPTGTTPIGRSVLRPTGIQSFKGSILETDHVIHLLGHRLKVRGFPYMQQHTDVSVCAHAACWSILRHYSERHRKYAEFLTYEITEMASAGRPGGLAPSRGLRLEQACQVFSEAGLFPDVYVRHKDKVVEFYRRLYAYVASGIPIFAGMSDRQHAITVIGHGPVDFAGAFNDEPDDDKPLYCWQAVNSFVVMDDNKVPYWLVPTLAEQGRYSLSSIDAFVAPLPEKVFYPAEVLEKWIEALLAGKIATDLDLSHVKQTRPVVNYFLTTSVRLLEFCHKNRTSYPPALMAAIMELCLPQFVWVVEIADLTDWRHERCNIRFVVDATAGPHDDKPFFVIHDATHAYVYDRAITGEVGRINFSGAGMAPMSSFQGNLGRYW